MPALSISPSTLAALGIIAEQPHDWTDRVMRLWQKNPPNPKGGGDFPDAQREGMASHDLLNGANPKEVISPDVLHSLGRDGDTMVAHINPQEAAILRALGGRGTTNPATGLPEFAWIAPAATQAVAGNYSTPLTSGVYGVAPSDFGPVAEGQTLPGYVQNWLSANTQGGTGELGTFMVNGQTNYGYYTPGRDIQGTGGGDSGPQSYYSEPQFQPIPLPTGAVDNRYAAPIPLAGQTAGNVFTGVVPDSAAYSIDPTTSMATPTALQQAVTKQTVQAEKASQFSPIEGLSLLAIPALLALAGPLIGLEGITDAGGSAAFAGGVGAYADQLAGLGALGGLGGAGSATAGLDLGALAADLPSLGAGNATAAGAGALGAASPELASGAEAATLATSGLGAAETGTSALDAAMAADLPSAGAGGATGVAAGPLGTAAGTAAEGSVDFGALAADLPSAGAGNATGLAAGPLGTADFTGAGSVSAGLGGLGDVSAGAPAIDLGSPGSNIFLGATDTGTAGTDIAGPAVAQTVPSGGVIGGGGGAVGGSVLPTDVLGDVGTGVYLPDVAGVVDSGGWTGAGGGLFSGGISDALSWIGDKALGYVEKNPLGLLMSALGLGYTALQGNKSIASLQGGPQALAAQHNLTNLTGQLSSDLSTGTLPPAVQHAIDQETGQITNLGSIASGLLGQVNSGTLPPAVTQALDQERQQASQLLGDSATLMDYLRTGTLPPAMEAANRQTMLANEAAVRSRYAAAGMSGSSAEVADLNNARTTAFASAANIQTTLYNTGVQEAQSAASLTQNIASQTASVTQTLLAQGTAEANAMAQLVQAISNQATSITQTLLNADLSATGMSADLALNILKISSAEDSALGNAITALAAATARPTISLNTGTV